MRAADEVAGRAVDAHPGDRHVAGHQLLHEDQRVALQLVEQRADAGRSRRQARAARRRPARRARARCRRDRSRRARRARGPWRSGCRGGGRRGGARPAAELELRRAARGRAGARRARCAPSRCRASRAPSRARPARRRAPPPARAAARPRRRPRAPATPAAGCGAPAGARLARDPRLHDGGEVGRRGPGDVLAQGEQLELELGHGAPTSSTPACARRRSSAREVRDLTVPRRQPSAAAVSSSESSSR